MYVRALKAMVNRVGRGVPNIYRRVYHLFEASDASLMGQWFSLPSGRVFLSVVAYFHFHLFAFVYAAKKKK